FFQRGPSVGANPRNRTVGSGGGGPIGNLTSSAHSRRSTRRGAALDGTSPPGSNRHSTSKWPRYPKSGPQRELFTATSMRNRPVALSNHSWTSATPENNIG